MLHHETNIGFLEFAIVDRFPNPIVLMLKPCELSALDVNEGFYDCYSLNVVYWRILKFQFYPWL